MKNKILITTLIITLLLTTISAASDNEEHQVEPINFTFEYQDQNTSTYLGDEGLSMIYFQDKNTNKTYATYKENARALAKLTQKTFKFTEPIKVKCFELHVHGEDYWISEIYTLNGTKCRPLFIDDTTLTHEEKQYFDNFDEQLHQYQVKQEDLSSRSEAVDRSSQLKHKSSGVMIGTGGVNYYHEL
ncbi:hypothetical protein [uncultured Methanosphaera sp.]|uniref:hypothetical protein n=1 Tax=uncultured Methanosphaera sp. TaxID=262501 RepID=UPI002805DA98|nr:hypothetical protein [uncultured Methanosphaera sp.]